MQKLFEILGKKQAFAILVYLLRHPKSTASELASALGIHIATAQRYLEGLEEGGLLFSRERPSKPRTAQEYWLVDSKFTLEIDVGALAEEEERKGGSGRLAALFIREKARPDVAFEWDDSGKRITAVLFFKKGMRRRLERKVGFSKEEGRFLWHTPFQSEKFKSVAEVLREAGLELEELQVLRMVDRLKSLGIVTVENEVVQ
jgi:DNA-binding HxlR family transcriptional regulator